MRRRKGGGKDRDTQRRRGGRGQDRDRQQFRLEPGEEAGARGGALTTLQYSTGQATGQDGFPNQRERERDSFSTRGGADRAQRDSTLQWSLCRTLPESKRSAGPYEDQI